MISHLPGKNPLQGLAGIINMLPTTIRSPPLLNDYISLEDHQSQTPETFFGGKPVLHHHLTGAKIWIPKSQRGSLPIFPPDTTSGPTLPESGTLNDSSEELVEAKVDLFVNSGNLTIFSPAAEAGVSIPYPAISIHATKQLGSDLDGNRVQAVWMQLELADGGVDDDDFNTIDLTIIPPRVPAAESSDSPTGPSVVSKLYEAISACSDLHPDPVDGDDDDDEGDRIIFEGDHEAVEGFTSVLRGNGDGGLPPPFPGSSGWITADNMHEYFDADGNWIGDGAEDGVSGELGEGAGRVRVRDEIEAEEVNGHGDAEDSENKRPRVD